MQCKILRHLFGLVEHGKITSPLWNPQQAAGVASNQQYVRVYLANMLSKYFKNLSKEQVSSCVQSFFNISADEATYRTGVRDFLIQLAEFGGGDDNKALYQDDKESAKQAINAAQDQIRAQIPGALNPHDIDDEDDL